MFKKPFKIANSHSLAGKDRKKLREQLAKQGFAADAVEALLDDKQNGGEELLVDKLQGSKAQVLTRGKTPEMFTVDSKQGGTVYLPTVYLLFQYGEKLSALRVYLKEGVEQYIFNGADLMWPGIKSLNTEDFKQYDVAVIYAKNQSSESTEQAQYAPVAVGKILTGKVPEELKGKAVQVEHYLYDELWNAGPRKIPDEIKLIKEDAAAAATLEDDDESKQQCGASAAVTVTSTHDDEEQKEVETTTAVAVKEEVDDNDGVLIIEEQKIPVEEMDARVIEAFYRCLLESVKNEDMPMEPSDFQKDHLNLYSAVEGYKLDLRLSSFKRVGKLLELMHKKGVVDYSEVKGVNHKLIQKIYRDNEEFKSYVPKYSLRKNKKSTAGASAAGGTADEAAAYPKVHVEEIYEPAKYLSALLAQVKETQLQQYYSLKELRDLVGVYLKQNQLDQRKGLVKVDPIVAQLLSPSLINKEGEVAKDILLKAVANHVKECYQIVRLDEEEVVKQRVKICKGAIPHVLVKAQKVSNKKQTTIQGLELFQVDYDELLPYLSHKCAGSATMHDAEGGAPKGSQIVLVQGQHLDTIVEALTKRYKVPQKYIDSVNNIESKKGKKR